MRSVADDSRYLTELRFEDEVARHKVHTVGDPLGRSENAGPVLEADTGSTTSYAKAHSDRLLEYLQ